MVSKADNHRMFGLISSTSPRILSTGSGLPSSSHRLRPQFLGADANKPHHCLFERPNMLNKSDVDIGSLGLDNEGS